MAHRILVVDDEPVNRELEEAVLASAGYEVRLAPDGPAALALAQADSPDLVLLDLLMPGMHGQEVCEKLKADPRTADIPVIVVTAVARAATKEALLTSGADDFVTKPFRPGDLLGRVEAMLKVRSIRRELDRTLAYLHELEAVRHTHRRAVLSEAGGAQTLTAPAAIPVLLVDDEALTRDFYGDLLTSHGFQVFLAASGPEGLALAHQHRVEAVILDIMMPEMSGLEVLERLRREQPDLPVIMLTAAPTSLNAIAALKLGAFDFIVKGLDHSLVVLAAHRAIRHRQEGLQQKNEIARLRARVAELEARRG